YSIEKAIGEDQQQYLRENQKETNNAIILLRGDDINTNLRRHIVKDNIDLIPFQRYGWSGRIIIDKTEHITYSIMTEGTLATVPRKKNRINPHYLQSILYAENKECIAKERQMTLQDFGITIFDTDVLEQDFEKISQGLIDREEDYRHYIVSYIANHGEIKSITLKFLDKEFNIVDEESLMQYIRPDFAQLTNMDSVKESDENNIQSRKSLVAVRSGVKPKLQEIEKRAEK
ncbi:MAG: hypothetical protein J6D08_17725, partial [Lachnospiraceae bacterium]|nr:hypothetical protein [Lachnospiraceae bacterium]